MDQTKLSQMGLLLLLFGLTTLFHCASPTKTEEKEQAWHQAYIASNPLEASSFALQNNNQLPIPDGESSYHQQGIQRLADGGWAVSGSDQDNGYLYFTDAEGVIHTKFTVPTDLKLQGEAANLKYNHPGGFQIVGDILAVGIENTDLRRDSYSRVILLDISDPKAPKHLSHLDMVREAESGKIMSAGAVGITELKDSYLIAVGNWDSKRFDFYQTSGKDLQDPTTSVSACLGSWTPGEDGNSYQNFNLYGNVLEELYAIGLYSINRDTDWADILRIDAADWNNIRLQEKEAIEYQGGDEHVRFVHAAGSYYDKETNRFLIFGTEAHLHDGLARCNIW